MSGIKWNAPAHIPSFKEYRISGPLLKAKYEHLGVELPFPISDNYYYHTDAKGWSKLLPDLLLKSSLYKKEKFDCPIPQDLAFAFGLFFADGHCGSYKQVSAWRITNTNSLLLKACIKPLDQAWPDLKFEIHSYPSEAIRQITNYGPRKKSLSHLEARVRQRNVYKPKRKPFIKEFREMFYTELGYKKTPGCIMENCLSTKKVFIEGVIEGDADKKSQDISVHGETGKWQIIVLLGDLGYNPHINLSAQKNETHSIHYSFRRRLDNFILEYLRGQNQFISCQHLADLFQVTNGAMQRILDRLQHQGCLLIHKPWSQRKTVRLNYSRQLNCEDYALKAQSICAERYGLNTLRYTYGRIPLGPHAFCSFFDGDVIWLFEPNEGFEDERGTWQDLWGYLDGDLIFPWGANEYICTHVLL